MASKTSRRILRGLLRKYIRSQKKEGKALYSKERRVYKQLIKAKKTYYKKEAVTALVTNLHDPSVFWKNVKRHNAKAHVDCRIGDDV